MNSPTLYYYVVSPKSKNPLYFKLCHSSPQVSAYVLWNLMVICPSSKHLCRRFVKKICFFSVNLKKYCPVPFPSDFVPLLVLDVALPWYIFSSRDLIVRVLVKYLKKKKKIILILQRRWLPFQGLFFRSPKSLSNSFLLVIIWCKRNRNILFHLDVKP